MSNYTFYWRDGKKSVHKGMNPTHALSVAGYGHGAIKAIDFWVEGYDDKYEWVREERAWARKETLIEKLTDEWFEKNL